jgi:NAD(P)-dependent dehydrogenase (short-subunit alcohol dehydrogenase family)
MNQKVAVVTGSSSGMGYETSLILARNGFHTCATMRKLDGGGGGGSKQIIDIAKNENLPLQVIQLDVNNDKSVTEAINRIANEKGRIDVVINNATLTNNDDTMKCFIHLSRLVRGKQTAGRASYSRITIATSTTTKTTIIGNYSTSTHSSRSWVMKHL